MNRQREDRPRRPGIEEQIERRFLGKSVTPIQAASAIAGVSLGVSILAGAVAHWIGSLPSVWLGIYWAVQTVTTVGFGDVTPAGNDGKALSIVLMLIGTAFVGVVTAGVTTIFVERARRLRAMEGTTQDPALVALHEIQARLERIEAHLGGSETSHSSDG